MPDERKKVGRTTAVALLPSEVAIRRAAEAEGVDLDGIQDWADYVGCVLQKLFRVPMPRAVVECAQQQGAVSERDN